MSAEPTIARYPFTLTPAGHHDAPVAVRLAAAVERAEALDLRVVSITVVIESDRPNDVRHLLKFSGRRLGLRASWPEPDQTDQQTPTEQETPCSPQSS